MNYSKNSMLIVQLERFWSHQLKDVENITMKIIEID